MKKIDYSTLDYMGFGYQLQLVKCMIEDTFVFITYKDLLNETLFTNEYLKLIVKWVMAYYDKYKKIPSYDDIIDWSKDKFSDSIRLQNMMDIIDVIQGTEVDFRKFRKDGIAKLKLFHLQYIVKHIQDDIDDSMSDYNFLENDFYVRHIEKLLQSYFNELSTDKITFDIDAYFTMTRYMEKLKAENEYLKLRLDGGGEENKNNTDIDILNQIATSARNNINNFKKLNRT